MTGDASVATCSRDPANGGALRALLASDVRPWYAVVDFLAFEPDDVRPILELGERAGLYVVISTDSVYMACAPVGFVRDAAGRLDEMSIAQRDAARAPRRTSTAPISLRSRTSCTRAGHRPGYGTSRCACPTYSGRTKTPGGRRNCSSDWCAARRWARGSTAATPTRRSVVFAADVGAAIAQLLEAPREAVAGAGALHIYSAQAPAWRKLVELAAELLRDKGIDVPPVVFDDAKENPLVSVDVGALSGARAAKLLPGWAPAPLRQRLAEAVEAWVAEMRDAYDGQVRDEERRAAGRLRSNFISLERRSIPT